MDGATLRAKVWAGYGKAAKRVGFSYQAYRPALTGSPIDPGNLLPPLMASFTVHASGFNFDRPPDHRDTVMHGLFDATGYLPGDYLIGQQGTFFIAGDEPSMPIICIRCSSVVTLSTPSAGAGAACGLGPYSGNNSANEAVFATGWPAAINIAGSGRGRQSAGLPMDQGVRTFELFLPPLPQCATRVGMIVTDDLSQRYVVSAIDPSPYGERALMQQQVV